MKFNQFFQEAKGYVPGPNVLPAYLVLMELARRMHDNPKFRSYKRVVAEFLFEPYVNGREFGLTIRSGADVRKSVTFSECRNSDDVVVYSDFVIRTQESIQSVELKHGGTETKYLTEHDFNSKAYEHARYFRTPKQAARHIAKVMRKWPKLPRITRRRKTT